MSELTDKELVQLLSDMAEGDLAEGAEVVDHPAYIAAYRITQLGSLIGQLKGDFPEDYAKELALGMVRDFAESFPADPEAFDTFHISEDDLYRGIFSALTWIDTARLIPWVSCNERMPEDGDDVAYRDESGELHSFENCDEGDRLKMKEYGAVVWMPIPPTQD
jgi:hypothetical protein